MKFSFSISSDTLNGKVSAQKLDQEIRKDISIPIELVGVTTHGDFLGVEFQADLNSEQEAELRSLVGAHDGTPLPVSPSLAVRNSDGCLRVVQEPSASTSLMQVVGFRMTPESPANMEEVPKRSNYDFELPAPLDIQGVHSVWMEGNSGHEDDFLDFTVVFPQGASESVWASLGLGPWPFSSSTEATVEVELLKYGVGVYLPRDGQVVQVLANGSKTVCPPLLIRISYFAHEVAPSVPVKVKGNLRWWLLNRDRDS